jgi:signal transduction histidine kinase
MRERAVTSGGSLQLISEAGKGTQVVARLPLNPQS